LLIKRKIEGNQKHTYLVTKKGRESSTSILVGFASSPSAEKDGRRKDVGKFTPKEGGRFDMLRNSS